MSAWLTPTRAADSGWASAYPTQVPLKSKELGDAYVYAPASLAAWPSGLVTSTSTAPGP